MKSTKICTACQRELPLEAFRLQSGTKDGRQYECRVCMSIRACERYQSNPEILEKNKNWQAENKDKHNSAAKKYYHSPTGRMNRSFTKAFDSMFGKKRSSTPEILGTSVSALIVHLLSSMPDGLTLDDYETKWFVGFVKSPSIEDNKDQIRVAFHWKNLTITLKDAASEDFFIRQGPN